MNPIDPELAEVFLEEARGHLALLASTETPAEARLEAARSLEQAAGLVGLDAVKADARLLERALRVGEEEAVTKARLRLAGRLEVVADELRRGLSGPIASLEPIGDVGLGPDESRIVRRIFLDEALEHLEAIATRLQRIETGPLDPAALGALLRATHTLKGAAATVGLREAGDAAHRLESAFAALQAGRLASTPRVLERLIAATDGLRTVIEAGVEGDGGGEAAAITRLDELLGGLEGASIGPDRGEPEGILLEREVTRPRGRAPTAPIDQGPADPDADGTPAGRRRDDHLLRVPTTSVNQIMDTIGELVFDRTRIERRVQELRATVRAVAKVRGGLRALLSGLEGADPALASGVRAAEQDLAEALARLLKGGGALVEDTEALRSDTTTLQRALTRIRMVPMRQVFGRLARPLRELAREAGRKVELRTAGEDTELDKAVVEQIGDPLVQLLRNAVAHGIESPEERVRRGKPIAGRITLSARHQGDSVYLEVADDGAGIDTARLRDALVATGKMSAEDARGALDERVLQAIFEPGVSSRDRADNLAGRGVGLDLVRERIAKLGGEVTVHSAAGLGTRFALRLPLTTALTQAMLFKVAGQVYALPRAHVLETQSLPPGPPPATVELRGAIVPLVILHDVLDVGAPDPSKPLPVVGVEYAGRRFGVACDRVIGLREIVLKGLGPLLAPLGLYAGATISGAGKVQLILDSAALARAADAGNPDLEPLLEPGLADDAPVAVAARAATTPPVAAGPSVRLLVADDSKTVRESLARMLTTEGYVVDAAVDGTEALRMLGEVPYDLLVTDLEMPGLDGWALIETLRRDPRHRALPILVVSSQKGAHARLLAEEAGASAFLVKPITRKALALRIGELLGTAAR